MDNDIWISYDFYMSQIFFPSPLFKNVKSMISGAVQKTGGRLIRSPRQSFPNPVLEDEISMTLKPHPPILF